MQQRAEKGRIRARQNKNAPKVLGEAPEITISQFTPNIWDEDMDMVNLRMHFRPEIRQNWDRGIDAFVAGDWVNARAQFRKVLNLTNGKDGPSRHLLKKMEAYSYEVPVDWRGFRHL